MDDPIFITKELDALTSDGDKKKIGKSNIYKTIANWKLPQEHDQAIGFLNVVMPKVQYLIEIGVLRKDLILLSIVATQNFNLLEKLLKYEKEHFTLNLNQSSSLYNFCTFKKEHWIAAVEKNFRPYAFERNVFSDNISKKLIVLKCLNSTINKFNLNKIVLALKDYEEFHGNDDTLDHLVFELKKCLDIIIFCKSIGTDVDEKEVYNVMCSKNTLDTLSIFLPLEKTENWSSITQKLKKYDECYYHKCPDSMKKSEVFKVFTILATVFDFDNISKANANSMNDILDDLKNDILTFDDPILTLELLEDIFSILFLSEKHIDDLKPDIFKNNEAVIRSILYLIKEVIEVLQIKAVYKNTESYQRFSALCRYVHDTLWRLEIVSTVKGNSLDNPNKILGCMLASPMSLLTMCLRQGSFHQAYQVVELFNMKDTEAAKELIFTENLQKMRMECRKLNRIKQIKESTSFLTSSRDEDLANYTNKIMTTLDFKIGKKFGNIAENADCLNYLCHYKLKNETFMNIVDFLCTETSNLEMSNILLKMAIENNTLCTNVSSSYSRFYEKLLAAAEHLVPTKNLPISDIILSSDIPLDISEYLAIEKSNEELILLYDEIKSQLVQTEDGILNPNHPAHKTYSKIETICKNYSDDEGHNMNYLRRLFNYLKAFSRVLYIEENTSDIISKGKNTSYFELLDYNRSELMGQLLFEKNLDPTDFEIYFSRMELDFLYHLIGNCFPTINLHSEEFVKEEELFPENNLYVPTKNIINYILRRNWLLALILQEMYEVPNVKMNINDARIKAFLNYRKLDAIQNLKCIFDHNEIAASLQREISYRKIKEFIEQKLQDKHSATPQYYDPDEMLEEAEELTEESSGKTEWNKILEILQAIPEIQKIKHTEFQEFQDQIVCKYINDHFEEDSFKKIYLIQNRSKRLEIILRNVESWPYDFCLDVLKSEENNFVPPDESLMEQLQIWQQTIELYGVLSEILNLPCWSDCGPVILNDIQGTFKKLVDRHKVSQILVLIRMHKPPGEILRTINEDFFLNAFDNGCQLSDLNDLLGALPTDHSVATCNKLLKMTSNLDFLNFIVDYLKHNTNQPNLKMLRLSLKIFERFSESQCDHIIYLIENPLDIIEVLVMNTKFEELASVLEVINQYEDKDSFASEIDRILRIYAEKSLEFHVITQSNPQPSSTVDFNLMETASLDSTCSKKIASSASQEVTKDNWIKDNEVLECMCCKNVNFSILNRRHHCRKCGRLVCYKCSTKRTKIPTYGDILVRVCDECYKQIHDGSISTDKSETVSVKSNSNYMWTLTDDEEHNKIVRDEFAYEYTPSVSLCLSILKFHSKTEEYPKFLLNHSNNLLNMFPPFKKFLPDIDYLLIIRMLKSLVTVAKMLSQEYSLIHNMSLADSLLNQVELLELFSERGCLNLLPVSTTTFTPSIDASILRRFRDNLLEMEEWNLALEVSTKAALDQTSVFAAWGKKLLKAGCLTKAREKIHRCFNANRRFDSLRESFSENDDERSTRSSNYYLNNNFNEFNEKKPLTNSPLLNEIINILECKSAVIDKNIVDEVSIANSSTSRTLSQNFFNQKDPAVSILNKLRNLDCIASGKYYFPTDRKVQISYATNRPIVDTVFYNECIFYLNRYGSHQSLLDFYIKHGELDQALHYILGNNMNSDVFIEIYMNCLKDGLVNVLQENIAKIDSTLDVWKNYLHQLCRYLEQQKFLHSLYQLQLFMGDYMRAAITCIRFYQENTKNFSDLARKNKYLHKAEEHIKQMHEQDEWIEVMSVGTHSTSAFDVYEEKLLGNPSIVMKPNYKDSKMYMNIIWSQNEVASFLADCEAAGLNPVLTLSTILPDDNDSESNKKIPTLFGTYMDKIRLAILILVTSDEIKAAFKIVSRLISEFKLRPRTIFSQTGKHLAKMQKYEDIKELVSSIRSSFNGDKSISDMCDEMLTVAVATLSKDRSPVAKIEDLIKLITDKACKISAFIEAKQLKTAYFLALRSRRTSDIRRILREAELNNQPNIKALCLKVLQDNNTV